MAAAKGAALEHLRLQHPFYQREVPVVLGEHVTTEAGTGAVHTAPGHGEEDFHMGVLYDLPVTNPVGPNSTYLEDVELFAGQWVWKANDSIIQTLEESGALLFKEDFEHSWILQNILEHPCGNGRF